MNPVYTSPLDTLSINNAKSVTVTHKLIEDHPTNVIPTPTPKSMLDDVLFEGITRERQELLDRQPTLFDHKTYAPVNIESPKWKVCSESVTVPTLGKPFDEVAFNKRSNATKKLQYALSLHYAADCFRLPASYIHWKWEFQRLYPSIYQESTSWKTPILKLTSDSLRSAVTGMRRLLDSLRRRARSRSSTSETS